MSGDSTFLSNFVQETDKFSAQKDKIFSKAESSRLGKKPDTPSSSQKTLLSQVVEQQDDKRREEINSMIDLKDSVARKGKFISLNSSNSVDELEPDVNNKTGTKKSVDIREHQLEEEEKPTRIADIKRSSELTRRNLTAVKKSDSLSSETPKKNVTDVARAKSPSLPLPSLGPIERCIAAAVKGFVIGSGIKGGLALFGIIGRVQRQLSGRGDGKALANSSRGSISIALKETLQYGFFLGTFAGGYSFVDEFIAAWGGLHRTAKWRPFFAGAVAGPALLLTGSKSQHTSMALYVLLRATVLATRCCIKSPNWGWLFRPLNWQYGDVLLMCISSAQILYAWIFEPHSLPASYVSFLNKHGGKDRKIINAWSDIASSKRPIPNLDIVKTYYKEKGVNVSLDPHMEVPCGVLHPNQQCVPHFTSFLKGAYFRAVPVYLPVYFVSALLVHRKALLHRPVPILAKTIMGAARSSSFLALYCSSAWIYSCLLHQTLGRCNGPTIAIAAFPVGISVLLEKKSRRMELALYCFSRAIESFGICASKWGWIPSQKQIPKRVDVFMFSAATAVIMHCYNNERDVFRSKYLNVLDWVFGVPPLLINGTHRGSIEQTQNSRGKSLKSE